MILKIKIDHDLEDCDLEDQDCDLEDQDQLLIIITEIKAYH